MKSTTKPRLVRLAGLFLLAWLVLAIAVPMAQAAAVNESGAGGGPGTVVATAGTQGRGGVSYAPGSTVAVAPGSAVAVTPRSAGVQPSSGSSSSTTAWIIAGSVVAASLVALGAWALVGRSRRRQSLTAYCVQHPSDAVCMA
jgi:hypothetical protein